MSKGNAHETAYLSLIFNATTFADLAENDTTSPATSLYVALHTADPGEAGTQATNECTYGAYARVAVVRSGSGWTVSGNQVSNAAAIDFAEATSGSETASHFSVGTTSTGATMLLYSAALDTSRLITTGVTPSFAIGALVITED